MTKKVMEQALDALEPVMDYGRPGSQDSQQVALQAACAALREAIKTPDCRTCLNFHDEFEVFTGCGMSSFEALKVGPCVNGDKYKPTQGLRFYKRVRIT